MKSLVDKAGAPVGAAAGADAGGRSGAASGAWIAKVASRIRSNTVFGGVGDISGNPRAHFSVQTLPDCTVTAVRLTRSSGIPAWDNAAERAIFGSSPFPLPPGGRCDAQYLLSQGPKDDR